MADRPTAAQRWFMLACEDLAAAHVLLAERAGAFRIAGFLAQQASEKSLKAGLFALEVVVPKIHGLNQLLARYPSDRMPLVSLDDLDRLDPWVFDGRYAADLPDLGREEAVELVALAAAVVAAVSDAILMFDSNRPATDSCS